LDIIDPRQICPSAATYEGRIQWGAVTEVTRSWIWIELTCERKLHWECQLLGALP